MLEDVEAGLMNRKEHAIAGAIITLVCCPLDFRSNGKMLERDSSREKP